MMNTARADHEMYDAVVVGAGYSGLAMLHHLREIGLSTLVVDGADGIGGTWWSNRYPGVRTDSAYDSYAFTFSTEVRDEWDWTERYPRGEEIRAYLEFVADRLDLRRDIRLSTRVERAEHSDATNLWTLSLADGSRLQATYLVSATGLLSRPVYPDIPGIDSFAGPAYHSARWPHEGVDLTGKRVGMIGVGASGIQMLPELAGQAAHVTVFQRTPNYVVESTSPAVTPTELAWLRENYDAVFERAAQHPFGVPMDFPAHSALDVDADERRKVFESRWRSGGFHFAMECFTDVMTSPEASEYASEFIRSKIRETVTDPGTAQALCPTTYTFMGKRPPTGHGFYDAFNRENVELVDVLATPITQVTPRGVVVDGVEHELDVLVLATGFDAMTGALTAIDVVGREGITLRERWERDGLRTYLGISVHGFPNFFMSLGPQTPLSNLPVPVQLGAQWLQRTITFARDNDVDQLEATRAAEEWWRTETDRAARATVMYTEGLKAGAWFLGGNVPGKRAEMAVYLGGGQVYQGRCREAEAEGYAGLRPAAELPSAHALDDAVERVEVARAG
ncbi:flavin-containing monooxygenase [Cellulosimicrobium arenosum]|uniref:NAD(P)/FAD-dependent oxidoreductase n=1 Tax=Cellulosimicrobium arenosum TaxID=2708133 RepID=A0A927IW73_9MICO|nr:NAD(P)/FAD-dependent oxidoreductase [Cellulosimicrobium arenosum]MBD8077526.1 NAD(P)/FAD-dependent oxidoreductase [Cellulosimicrobium arenosum]